MDENTNSTGAEVVSESLFDEAAEETTEATEQKEAEAEVETQEDAPEETEAEKDNKDDTGNEQTVKIKYNGEDLEIPISEAVALAQKGKNYDKLQQRYDELKNGAEMKLISAFAKQAGMTVKQYLKFANEQQQSQQVQAELDAIMEHDPEVDPVIAKELAEARAAKKTAAFAQQQHDEDLKPWEDFLAAYPELGTDVKKLPEEVQAAIANGESPIGAMRAYELQMERKKSAELQRLLEAEKQNKKNKQASTGSVKSAGKAEKDPFLEGFMD